MALTRCYLRDGVITKTRCWSPESFASVWPELIIIYDVRERGLLQTDRRTDITTGLHIASFVFTGADVK